MGDKFSNVFETYHSIAIRRPPIFAQSRNVFFKYITNEEKIQSLLVLMCKFYKETAWLKPLKIRKDGRLMLLSFASFSSEYGLIKKTLEC